MILPYLSIGFFYLCSQFMKDEGRNIFSVFDELLQKEDKELFLKQRGVTIWMTGLSGSGKTTIAKGLEKKLHQNGFLSQISQSDPLINVEKIMQNALQRNYSGSVIISTRKLLRLKELIGPFK